MPRRPPEEMKVDAVLTPLLDIVFQLMTFFMMVTNFSQDAYDQKVRLPVAGSAKPVEGDPSEDRLVLNIDRDGNLLVNGRALGSDEAYKEIAKQARLVKINLEFAGKKTKPGEPLPTTLVVRADRSTPFEQFYRLITKCQSEGFHKFALKALDHEA